MIRKLFKRIRYSILIILLLISVPLLAYHTIGILVYLKATRNIPKMSTIEEQLVYETKKTKELANVSPYRLLFAGGGWRFRAVLKLNEKVFEYFPNEARNNVNALSHLADAHIWLGGKDHRKKAIELYRRCIEVFKEKHLNEKPATGIEPKQFELQKYKFLGKCHFQIASIYFNAKKYDNAIAEYQKVIDLYSDKLKSFANFSQYLIIGNAYENIAAIHLWCHNYNIAIELYEKVQQMFPSPLVVSRNKTWVADCYLAMGNEEKAKEIYQSVIDEFKDNEEMVEIEIAKNALKDLARHKRIITKYAPILQPVL